MNDTSCLHETVILLLAHCLVIRAYSSTVERTAHNGLVVGSNPTKPNNIRMKLTIKTYKYLKMKKCFKKANLIYILNTLTEKNEIYITQKLKRFEVNHFRLYNALAKLMLRESIHQNYISLVTGFVMIALPEARTNQKPQLFTSEILTLNGLKMNNKIYSTKQLSLCNNFKYRETLLRLAKTFRKSLTVFKLSD